MSGTREERKAADMKHEQLMAIARRIVKEKKCLFFHAYQQAKDENPQLVEAIRAGGVEESGEIHTVEASYTGRMSVVSGAATSYPINNADAANERLHETSNGPEKQRVDYSSGERLLARAKVIQKSSGCSFSTAWLRAAAEHPEWVNSKPSGEPEVLDLGAITRLGPETKKPDPYPPFAVTGIRTEDAHGPA